jgi:hypothetical protein
MHYWNVQARNIKTGQTLKQQDLTGRLVRDQQEAYQLAEQFAKSLSERTRESWVAQIRWVKHTG